MRTPVITGTGIICAAGLGREHVWARLQAGESALGPLTLFKSPRFESHAVGQVREDVDALCGNARGSRTDKLAWIAARQAMREAGLGHPLTEVSRARAGVIIGVTVGGMLGTEAALSRLLLEKRHRFGPLRFHECATATDLCASRLGLLGPCATLSTACSAGTMAIAAAAEAIVSGEADWMLAGGADSLCRLTLNGFGSLLLLDPAGCRPFDARRAGISLGEGAAMLVIEAEESAMERGAPVLARLSGWGASCDAWHATAPHPEGDGAVAAIEKALNRAGLPPAAIGFVSAHGTGTPDNDAMEAKALRRVFGERIPPTASLMRLTGHTLAASGAIKAVLAAQALIEQALPPSPGFAEADPRLGIEPVTRPQSQSIGHVLSNSFGFGGNNAALVLSSAASPSTSSVGSGRPVAVSAARSPGHVAPMLAITGFGVVSPAGNSMEDVARAFVKGPLEPGLFALPLPARALPAFVCGEFDTDALDPVRRRRMSRLQQMAVAAARQSVAWLDERGRAGNRVSVAFGTGFGSLNETAAFVENMILKEERAPRPSCFTNSVHNSLASQVALELGLKGPNVTAVQREISFEAALFQGAATLRNGDADLLIAGAADELNQYALAAGLRWGFWNGEPRPVAPFHERGGEPGRTLPGEGCVVFSVGRAEDCASSLARLRCVRIGRAVLDARGRVDARGEAAWIHHALVQDGIAPGEVDLLLTSANGRRVLDDPCAAVAAEFGRMAGKEIPCGTYKQCCGEWRSASAFGLLTAIGLLRGSIPLAAVARPVAGDVPSRCRRVALYTLTLGGNKALLCVEN